MKTRKKLFVLGCAGVLVICLAAPFLPYAWRVGQAMLARQRWAAHGNAYYTLVVGEYCFCPDSGEYKITVQNGVVTAVETMQPGATHTPNFANFNDLTVEAMLARAEATARSSWGVPWFSVFATEYDPTSGYVTSYYTDANGMVSRWTGLYITDSGYSYTARDLQIIQP